MDTEQHDPVTVTGEPVTVTAELATRFAEAVGSPAPGPDGTDLPVTLAAALTADVQRAVMAHPELRIDLSRTLHTAQSSRHLRPIRVGETLVATSTVTTVRPARGGRMISFDTVLADAAGAPVQVSSTSLLTAGAGS